jgi:hypothetical protein
MREEKKSWSQLQFSGLSDGSQRLPTERSPVARNFGPSPSGACIPGDDFGGRESIFSIPHTNEFSGMTKRAPDPPRSEP